MGYSARLSHTRMQVNESWQMYERVTAHVTMSHSTCHSTRLSHRAHTTFCSARTKRTIRMFCNVEIQYFAPHIFNSTLGHLQIRDYKSQHLGAYRLQRLNLGPSYAIRTFEFRTVLQLNVHCDGSVLSPCHQFCVFW